MNKQTKKRLKKEDKKKRSREKLEKALKLKDEESAVNENAGDGFNLFAYRKTAKNNFGLTDAEVRILRVLSFV